MTHFPSTFDDRQVQYVDSPTCHNQSYFANYSYCPPLYPNASYHPNASAYYNNDSYHSRRQHEMLLAHNRSQQGAGGRVTESKTRLSREAIAKLEVEFQKNHKPNSNFKKQLAQEIGVDISKVNNWFQNRRAKAKQERITQENKARQESEQDAEPTTNRPETVVKEYYASNDQDGDLRPSTALFPAVNASSPETTCVRESPSAEEVDATTKESEEKPQATTKGTDSDYSSPEFTSWLPQQSAISYLPAEDDFSLGQTCDFATSLPTEMSTQAACLTMSTPNQFNMPQIAEPASAPSLASCQYLSGSADLDRLYPQSATDASASAQIQVHAKQGQLGNGYMTQSNYFSPESITRSPPEMATPDIGLKSSSAIDIASRRNSKRPAKLGTNCMPGTGTGIEVPRRNGARSPRRRVTSATGNFARGIHKTASTGPPSPFVFDVNQENLIRSMAGDSPSFAAPPTPNTPFGPAQEDTGNCEASTWSVPPKDDNSYGVQTNLTVPPHTYTVDPMLGTPPDTPGFMNPSGLFFPTNDSAGLDEALSPFSLFGSELPISPNVPSYVAHGCGSQPVTPSFPANNMGSTFYTPWYGGGQSAKDHWTNASIPAKPSPEQSPEQSRSTQLEFTNMTAQDFHG